MTPVLHSISPAIADVLVASVWQSVLLTGAVALCLRLIPEMPAGTRSSLWTALLVLILLLPAVTVLLPHTAARAVRPLQLENRWSLLLVCVWAALSLVRAVQLCLSAARLRTLVRGSLTVEPDPAIVPLLNNGSGRVLLCVSAQVDRPGLIGFFRPRILLPAGLLENLSLPELEQIVVHEMEHLRRGDDWANLLQQISLVLLPWNPAVLWVSRRLSLERELACDDAVMRATNARKSYAACLVRLAEDSVLRRGVSLALGALGRFERTARESDLMRRVRRILSAPELGSKPHSMRAGAAALLFGVLGVSVLLARSPLLVNFASAPVSVASVAALDAPALQVSHMMDARPTMVKAVISDVPSAQQGVIRPVLLEKRTSVRHRTQRAFSDSAPGFAAPGRRGSVPTYRAVIALASADDSQRLYAAVPWQGGWLLIQL